MALKIGDIIAVSGKGHISNVINLGTFGLPGRGISHVGILAGMPTDLLVYESTSFGRPECALQGKRVSGVQCHRINDFLKFDNMNAVWHYPLRSPLFGCQARRLQATLDSMLGLPYDTAGAVRSGGFVYRMLQSMLRDEDLSSIFCSELIALMLVRNGVMHTHNASSWNPNKLVRTLVRNGTCESPIRLK